MSGIAEILIDQGFKITGSDKAASENTERLQSLGTKIYIGHDLRNLEPDVDAKALALRLLRVLASDSDQGTDTTAGGPRPVVAA